MQEMKNKHASNVTFTITKNFISYVCLVKNIEKLTSGDFDMQYSIFFSIFRQIIRFYFVFNIMLL